MTFFVPHFGQRRSHDIFIVYSDILELSERYDSDGRHLENRMQILEEFQWTGKLLHAWTQVEQDSYGCRLGLGSETTAHESCRQTLNSSRDNQTSSLYGRELMADFWDEKRLLSVEETAKYLGVPKSTIYSWASHRKIPSVKMGRRLLFDREDLDRMIEAGKRDER